MIEFDIEGDS